MTGTVQCSTTTCPVAVLKLSSQIDQLPTCWKTNPSVPVPGALNKINYRNTYHNGNGRQLVDRESDYDSATFTHPHDGCQGSRVVASKVYIGL